MDYRHVEKNHEFGVHFEDEYGEATDVAPWSL